MYGRLLYVVIIHVVGVVIQIFVAVFGRVCFRIWLNDYAFASCRRIGITRGYMFVV